MICVVCGKEFMPRNRGGMPQKICSSECKKIRIRELNKINYQRKIEQKKDYNKLYQTKKRVRKQMPKSTAKSLTELQKQAQSRGLSYGQYVAMTEGSRLDGV